MLVRIEPRGQLGAVPVAVPLIVGGIAALATADWDPLLQRLGLKQAPALTPTPQPLQPPPAPITPEALKAWTPTMLYESIAQRSEAQRETAAQIPQTAPSLPAAATSAGPGWMVWIALALAAAAFILIILPRGGH